MTQRKERPIRVRYSPDATKTAAEITLANAHLVARLIAAGWEREAEEKAKSEGKEKAA